LELKRYAALLQRSWWIVALVMLAAMAASYGVSKAPRPVFRAPPTLAVGASVGASGNASQYIALTTGGLLNQYARALTARTLAQQVSEQLKLDIPAEKLQSEMGVIEQNMQMISKLENFTGANLQHETEKGTLNSEAVMALSKYVMEGRADKAQTQVALRQKSQENQEQMQFAQRQLNELSAGSSKTERDAVIVVDKKNALKLVNEALAGWKSALDLDPTNNQIPADKHITVGWGRVYDDVSPIKGGILGGGSQAILVGVDVFPLEEEPLPGLE